MHPCLGSIILDVEAPILEQCFIATGFNTSNNAWYDSINSIIRHFGLQSYRNDKHGSDAIWMTQVMKEIARSGMVLALCKKEECQHTTPSLRGPNLNVLLEMGIALALRKPMITLWSTKLETPPSDISALSFIVFFNEDEPPERIRGPLIEELARAKKRVDNGSSFAFGVRYLMTRQDVVTSIILLLCFVSDHNCRTKKLNINVYLPSNSKAINTLPSADTHSSVIAFDEEDLCPLEHWHIVVFYETRKLTSRLGGQLFFWLLLAIISGLTGHYASAFADFAVSACDHAAKYDSHN